MDADLDSAAAERSRHGRSARGDARRSELLDGVVADVITNGLSDFSLRRAARACGTTHKVLLYHFGSAEELLAQVAGELRARRIARGINVLPDGTLAQRARALWPVLSEGVEVEALDQVMGLAMCDPARYGRLASSALDDYLPPLRDMCPPEWDDRRKDEVANLILATLRGLVLARRTSPQSLDPDVALAALGRALDAEEANNLDGK